MDEPRIPKGEKGKEESQAGKKESNQSADDPHGTGDSKEGEEAVAYHQVGAKDSKDKTEGGNNHVATAQIGSDNVNLSILSGIDNLIGTAQLGTFNSSTTLVSGNGNAVGTLQVGSFHKSNVAVFGSNAAVGVAQFGVGLETNLTVVDEMNPATSIPQPGLTTGTSPTGGLQVGVYQDGADAPVNATVGRDAVGTIIVRPGTATTVLTF